MAPAYANIVMSIFERNLLTGSCNKPLVWFRYIDDISAIWTYSENKFKDVLFYINSIHSSFQFTCNYSKECVHFLDVSVSVDNSGNITTDLYVKPTDTHQYLLATSCHTLYLTLYLIAKLSVYFVFVLTKKHPNYVVRSLCTAWLNEVIIKERLINR